MNHVERLLSELYVADPSLRDKEGILRSLLEELLVADPHVEMNTGFRAQLKHRLMAQPVPTAWTRVPRWVYYPLSAAAVAVLLLVVIRPTSEPQLAVPASPAGGRDEAPEMETMMFSAPANDSGFAKIMTMQLTSSAFQEGQPIPAQYTCDGANTPPPLVVTTVPESAVSLVLIMNDPDAPREGGFTHWVVFDIAADAAELRGTDGSNDGGAPGYVGPCPPSGSHRYFFTLFALDALLGLPEGASEADVRAAMDGHVIGQAELMGTYQRQ
jgi:Raf kinase inhibitor-like YbhB/YbcL family protein